MDMQQLLRAQLGVVALAVFGIALFLLIYAALDGSSPAARLFSALLVPPLVLTVVAGGYYLVRKR